MQAWPERRIFLRCCFADDPSFCRIGLGSETSSPIGETAARQKAFNKPVKISKTNSIFFPLPNPSACPRRIAISGHRNGIGVTPALRNSNTLPCQGKFG